MTKAINRMQPIKGFTKLATTAAAEAETNLKTVVKLLRILARQKVPIPLFIRMRILSCPSLLVLFLSFIYLLTYSKRYSSTPNDQLHAQ
jgi:hypothetical protein